MWAPKMFAFWALTTTACGHARTAACSPGFQAEMARSTLNSAKNNGICPSRRQAPGQRVGPVLLVQLHRLVR